MQTGADAVNVFEAMAQADRPETNMRYMLLGTPPPLQRGCPATYSVQANRNGDALTHDLYGVASVIATTHSEKKSAAFAQAHNVRRSAAVLGMEST
jgi:hypothetical protein